MKPARGAFSILLPCFSIAIWLALVVMPVAGMYFRLRDRLPFSGPATLDLGNASFVLSRDRLLHFVLDFGAGRYSHLLTALNMPGFAVDLLSSIKTWPESWYPEWIGWESWLALIMPLYCLPVWWFAGRGIDAMLGRRRLGFLSLIFGTAVFLIFAIVFLGFSFALPPNELDGGRWIVWGPALWSVLFAAFPYDIYRRWSAGRKTCRLNADLG